jgi:carboxymethylenebutenolidase
VEFLRNHPVIDGNRLGITGFCMGGRVAWLGAASNPHFRALAPYYGGNLMVTWGAGTETPFDLAGGINCPVLFHFGEIDENPSQDDMRKLDTALTDLGTSHQFYTYPGANHAFMDFTTERYQQAASDASWPRTLEFFAANLGT